MEHTLRHVVLLPFMAGCGLIITGNGTVQSQDRTPAETFHRVDFAADLAGVVTEGATPSVVLRTDTNLFKEYKIYVANDTLYVDHVRPVVDLQPSLGSLVTVVLPSFLGATVSGSGSVGVTQSLSAPSDLLFDVSGSGSLSYTGTAQQVTAKLSGSGSATLSGTGVGLSAHVSGSGSLDAKGFAVVGADFDVSGSGGVVADVTGTVTSARISGSGSIDLFGGATVTQSVTGSGRVTVH